jgi:magnesium-transporting ATPase (P-type)
MNGYSAQIYFVDWLPMLFNAVFTSWPCIAFFFYERDISPEYSVVNPKLYQAGHKNVYFNFKVFWEWILHAIFHGFVAFFVPVFAMGPVDDISGRTHETWWFSTISFTLCLHIVTYKLFIMSNYWHWFSICTSVGSVLLYYILVMIFCVPEVAVGMQPEMADVIFEMFKTGKFWIVVIGGPLLALTPDVGIKVFRRLLMPTPSDIAQIKEKQLLSHERSQEISLFNQALKRFSTSVKARIQEDRDAYES